MHDQTPIAALASGHGGAIAIIRISGENSHNLLKKCILFKNPSQELSYGKMRLCDLIDPEDNIIIDEPMVVFFKSPHSYTGEDSVEIYLHAGLYIIQKTLTTLYNLGIKAAEPGEFTQRAYLNGKLDLTAAEGIKELISASSKQQWMAARQLATGKLSHHIEDLRLKLLHAMAWLEARIDFPDEKETSDVEMEEVYTRVNIVEKSLKKLISTFNSGQVAAEGLSVALIGKPNAGKSTLLNTLLGKERAIVTDIAGTTRDYIEEKCLVNGRLIRLIDTAGIRETNEVVEKIGVNQSIAFLEKADVVLFLASFDSNQSDLNDIDELKNQLHPDKYILVATKCDLQTTSNQWKDWCQISCLNDIGIQNLKDKLASKVDQVLEPIQDQTFITTPRHFHAVKQALASIEQFNTAAKNGHFEDMLAFELLQAAKALISIIGDVDSDEVLGVVFSSFCVGK